MYALWKSLYANKLPTARLSAETDDAPPPNSGQPFGQNTSKIPVIAYFMMGAATFTAAMSFHKYYRDTLELLLMLCNWIMGGAFVYIMYALRKQTFLSSITKNVTYNTCYTIVAVCYGIVAFIWGLTIGGQSDDRDTMVGVLLLLALCVCAIAIFILYGNLINKVTLNVKSWLNSLLPIGILLIISFIILLGWAADWYNDWDYDNINILTKFPVSLINGIAICYFGRMSIKLDATKQ